MTAIERAADIINEHTWDYTSPEDGPRLAAEALDATGLLVTDEAKAVLDAAVAWSLVETGALPTLDLLAAVEAYLASRQVTT